jgi:hypothetical protein
VIGTSPPAERFERLQIEYADAHPPGTPEPAAERLAGGTGAGRGTRDGSVTGAVQVRGPWIGERP